jgi:hypothetical protein
VGRAQAAGTEAVEAVAGVRGPALPDGRGCGRPSAATDELHQLDALVLAVSHKQYLDLPVDKLTGMLRKGGLLLDVKSALDPARVGAGVRYWSL